MTKDNGILILGLVVAVTPFLGIPGEWKTIIFVLAGILISFFAFLIKRDTDIHERQDVRQPTRRVSSDIVTPRDITSHEEKNTEEKS